MRRKLSVRALCDRRRGAVGLSLRHSAAFCCNIKIKYKSPCFADTNNTNL